MIKSGEHKKCAYCEAHIYVKRCRLRFNNFCSVVCNNKFYRGRPAWNKGTAKVSTENELFRKSKAYIDWRKSVFERDNYTCVLCGTYGGQLHADHIEPFALRAELRLSIENGRTLCVPCHKATPTYGWRTMHLKNKQNQVCV